MLHRLAGWSLAFVAAAAAAATPPLDAPLPPDPQLVSGVLPNGLRYQLLHHATPAKRVELRLVVAAGSAQESDTQQGYAHLLEHLAFRRTARFSGQDVMAFIEAAGMRIGPDSNAHTGFNETVYELALPTDHPGTVDRGVALLADWAQGIRFDPDEVGKESRIVTEEWRLSERRRTQRLPYEQQLYAGSRYLERPPIGRMEQVARGDIGELKAFYERWYRPERMAVVAVGDIDTHALEALIRRELGAIPASRERLPVSVDPVPAADRLRIARFRDDDGRALVRLVLPGTTEPGRTYGDYRVGGLRFLAGKLMLNRLREVAARPNQAIYRAGSGRGELPDRRVYNSFFVSPSGWNLKPAWEQLRTEVERAARFGFSEQEFRRVRAETLVALQRRQDQWDAEPADRVAARMVDALRDDETLQAPADELRVATDWLREDVLPDVNATFRRMAQTPDALVSLEMSANPRYDAPPEEAVRAFVQALATARLEPFQPASERTLDAAPPSPGKIVTERVDPVSGRVEWTLSNGAQVYVAPTHNKAREVLFEAAAPAGFAALSKTLYAAATVTSNVLNGSGVADFSSAQLERALEVTSVGLQAYADTYRHGLRGEARVDDLPTLLALVNQRLSRPRIDPDLLDDWIGTRLNALRRTRERSDDQLYLTMADKIWDGAYRKLPADAGWLRQVHSDDVKMVERRWFGHPGRFRYVFVGDLDPQQLKPLVETWLASLPPPDTAFDWGMPSPLTPAGGFREIRQHSSESQKLASTTRSETTIYLRTPAPADDRMQRLRRLLNDVLQRRLVRALREDAALTYHVSLSSSLNRFEGFAANIEFASDRTNASAALDTALKTLRALRDQGMSDAEFADARYRERRLLADAEQRNAVLRERIVSAVIDDRPVPTAAEQRALLDALTVDELNRCARAWLTDAGLSVAQINPRDGTY